MRVQPKKQRHRQRVKVCTCFPQVSGTLQENVGNGGAEVNVAANLHVVEQLGKRFLRPGACLRGHNARGIASRWIFQAKNVVTAQHHHNFQIDSQCYGVDALRGSVHSQLYTSFLILQQFTQSDGDAVSHAYHAVNILVTGTHDIGSGKVYATDRFGVVVSPPGDSTQIVGGGVGAAGPFLGAPVRFV